MPNQPFWWQRDDLQYKGSELYFADRPVLSLARRNPLPSFYYSPTRVKKKLKLIYQSLYTVGMHKQGIPRFKIYYAMKANRYPPLLTCLKQMGLCGIDACSPGEVELAIRCGFEEQDISFTAGNLSREDYAILSRYPGVHINCDSLTAIETIGHQCPGRKIGIRINPALGVGYGNNEKLRYSGNLVTKFGIYLTQFEKALRLVRKHKLRINTLHFHTGCGFLNQQLEEWDDVLTAAQKFIRQVNSLEYVNLGGGLGVPHVATDQALDLSQWANLIAKHFVDTDLNIAVEPGDYLVKDAGILVLTINTVEEKLDRMFVGLNAGFNVALEPVVYSLPFEPVPVFKRDGLQKTYTLAGNINEAMDIWYHSIQLPPLQRDDYIALINAGAYSSSMASNHCMRGEFNESLLL